jgi:gp16 family phage-associated protein
MNEPDRRQSIRTKEQVQEWFETHGIAISDWAKENGFTANVVYTLLSGRTRGRRGEAHRAAIALGMKPTPGSSDRDLFGPQINRGSAP